MTRNVVGGGQPTEQRRVERRSIARSGGGYSSGNSNSEKLQAGINWSDALLRGYIHALGEDQKKHNSSHPTLNQKGGEEGG